jgi:5'-3' exonuclease
MGIPSYFSYIIKNYSNIIRNLNYFTHNGVVKFQHLYMDCNSIVYDSVHLLEREINNGERNQCDDFECLLIDTVVKKIELYADFIKPSGTLFIAFDGVAPFAKMDQQRTRRYKSWFLSENSFENKGNRWNTSAITPGTNFMNKLSESVRRAFLNKEKKMKVKNIIVSGSDEPGEGEHKMYYYIRKNNSVKDYIAVYGLDADLIMLSIFHLKYSKNIYVFRETPEFFKSMIQVEAAASNEPHFLDIRQLSVSILCEMNCKFSDQHRINDYVFLCFFLGNDFLPHFPAMNIRTHGITALLDIYRSCIGNIKDKYFICSNIGKINWKNVGVFIKEIAKNEYQLLLTEYNVRKKFDKFVFLEKTTEEKDNILLNSPIIYRADEKYIFPEEPFWEHRYYRALFHIEKSPEDIKCICQNYFEGLEWVYRYYNDECPNWKWKYNYHYPPLFSDLCKFIPENDNGLVSPDGGAVSSSMQLCYVLPRSNLYLLPNKIEENINKNYLHLYPQNFEFKWAFCRYFWEAHPILPDISLEILKKIETES